MKSMRWINIILSEEDELNLDRPVCGTGGSVGHESDEREQCFVSQQLLLCDPDDAQVG